LVCSLLDVEEKLAEDDDTIGITRPLLTVLAIEEPENHIAPQLLGRVVKILQIISEKDNCQILLSSHTPAIIRRLDPTSIFHFRITEQYTTEVNEILLPQATDEAYKYIKEAIRNYPEIYFAKLVVIGEGDTEEVIFHRLMEVLNTDFDDNTITFAPLGHRFVNHIWKLLNTLHVPYITLLDLDIEREGGGWGRIKYALKQLINIGHKKSKLLELSDKSIFDDKSFEQMHTWSLKEKDEVENLKSWVNYLKGFDIYYSEPLDLDFLMLQHYAAFYKEAVPDGGGPRIPKKEEESEDYRIKIEKAVQATLKSEKATASTYSEDEKELMIWYNYHFLGRGKPATHIQVLSSMTNRQIKGNLPKVFSNIFTRISMILKLENDSTN
jgi:putative ATP-dependent endonuclease of OLD family